MNMNNMPALVASASGRTSAMWKNGRNGGGQFKTKTSSRRLSFYKKSIALAKIVVVAVLFSAYNILPVTSAACNIDDPAAFQTTQELYDAVDIYLADNSATTTVATTYGHPIGTWDVGCITDFSHVFDSTPCDYCPPPNTRGNPLAATFNEDISSWDVSSAINMEYMFDTATAFNQDLSSWIVSSVTTLEGMFKDAEAFSSDLSGWKVDNVENMASLFNGAKAFNSDLSGWVVSNVTSMGYMFNDAFSFNSDLSSWKTSKVTDMRGMFDAAVIFNSDLSGWDVSSVTGMDFMFWNATAFNSDLSGWNVKKVTSMERMFLGSSAFRQDLCSWGPDAQKNNASVASMFQATGCPDTNDPNLGVSPPGPFCFACTGTVDTPSSHAAYAFFLPKPLDFFVLAIVTCSIFELLS